MPGESGETGPALEMRGRLARVNSSKAVRNEIGINKGEGYTGINKGDGYSGVNKGEVYSVVNKGEGCYVIIIVDYYIIAFVLLPHIYTA